MKQYLAQLINASEPQFGLLVRQLEKFTGHTSIDLRLKDDLIKMKCQLLESFKLDPTDTTMNELLYTVIAQAESCQAVISQNLISTGKINNICELSVALTNWAEKTFQNPNLHVAKKTAIKKLLLKCPPKKIIVMLGFRSINAMIKNTPVDIVLALARQFEDNKWQSNWIKVLKTLVSNDFHNALPKFYSFELTKNINDIKMIRLSELGSIVIFYNESEQIKPSSILFNFGILQNLLEDLYKLDLFIQITQLGLAASENFAIAADKIPSFTIKDIELDWLEIAEVLTRNSVEKLPEAIKPLVNNLSINLQELEAGFLKVCNNAPILLIKSWLGIIDDGIVLMLNSLDIALNLEQIAKSKNNLTLSKNYGSMSLRSELMTRYFSREPLSNEVYDLVETLS